MFAGDRSYAVGDTVTLGDTVIPIIEFEWHNERAELDYRFLWDEYTWNGNVFPPAEEEGDELDLIMFASPGVGAAANSYLSLVNIEDSWIKIDRGVKADSPGIGASSPYYGREYQATKDIPAGAEIFVEYVAIFVKNICLYFLSHMFLPVVLVMEQITSKVGLKHTVSD